MITPVNIKKFVAKHDNTIPEVVFWWNKTLLATDGYKAIRFRNVNRSDIPDDLPVLDFVHELMEKADKIIDDSLENRWVIETSLGELKEGLSVIKPVAKRSDDTMGIELDVEYSAVVFKAGDGDRLRDRPYCEHILTSLSGLYLNQSITYWLSHQYLSDFAYVIGGRKKLYDSFDFFLHLPEQNDSPIGISLRDGKETIYHGVVMPIKGR